MYVHFWYKEKENSHDNYFLKILAFFKRILSEIQQTSANVKSRS